VEVADGRVRLNLEAFGLRGLSEVEC
jgi:hypothetical protein